MKPISSDPDNYAFAAECTLTTPFGKLPTLEEVKEGMLRQRAPGVEDWMKPIIEKAEPFDMLLTYRPKFGITYVRAYYERSTGV